MLEQLTLLQKNLHDLLGLHRQLLEIVRQERQALIDVDIDEIQNFTYSKEAIIETIKHTESERLKIITGFSLSLKIPVKELSLSKIIITIQSNYPEQAERLRGSLAALSVLVERVATQNKSNNQLLNTALEHVRVMKSNVLGERNAKSSVYTAKGKKSMSVRSENNNFISKEA